MCSADALVCLLTPQGQNFDQKMAHELSQHGRVVLICGHYEGIDERVRQHMVDREISVGDFVLTGGELPAMMVVDSVARLVPGSARVIASRRSATPFRL